jgi:hypothetical protein
MKRTGLLSLLIAAALLVVAPSMEAQAQTPASKPAAEPKAAAPKEAKAAGAKTPASKIQNAMSAAPRAIAKDATIMDWPAKEGAEPTVLRKGANEWTCFPDDPTTPGNDPMCLDKMWMVWAQAWMTKKEPTITTTGMAYMLQGGSTASNTDPFAKKPPAGEKWMKEQPHVMLLVPGKLDAKLYSSDPHSGGPWIMWGGTPYEHLMVPVK